MKNTSKIIRSQDLSHTTFITMIRGKTIFVFLGLFGVVLFFSGCADPRTPSPTALTPGYTETIVLWENAVSGGNIISAEFNVDDELAAIGQPGRDTPARLNIWAYIAPDADILERENIINVILPILNNQMISYQIILDPIGKTLDSLDLIDSLHTAFPDSIIFDTTGFAARRAELQPIFDQYSDSLDIAAADTTRNGNIRDSLGFVVDDRYRLTVWFDPDTSAVYPNATFINQFSQTLLNGQGIYLAETDALTNMKGKRMELNLAQFDAASPNDPGYQIVYNWVTCFPGINRCMSVGPHTLRARLSGSGSKITATLVLVYEGQLP